MASGRRVVVTGLGVATPIGIGIEPFWDGLIERRCGIAGLQAFDPSGTASRIGGELPPFQLGDCIPKSYRKSAKVMARDIMIAMVCAHGAVRDAALRTRCIIDRGEGDGPPNVDSTRFGANIGAGLICADLNELASALNTAVGDDRRFSLARWGTEGMNNLTPLWLLKFLPNMLACHVTIVHDAQAPSNTVTCGEASSHLAIGEAFRTIARDDADVCICGGAESKINPMALVRPQLWGRLNTEDNDRPDRASRPFASDRRGMVVAEGGGLVILEALDHARSRDARVYAEVVGFGAATGWTVGGQPDIAGRGVAGALRRALSDAGIKSADVQLVAPFGAGTVGHDASEIAGWNTAFGADLERCAAVSTRGSVGNSGAGSGAIDFAAAVMALNRNTVPPSLNTTPADSASRFQFVQTDPVDRPISHAVTLGHALSGGQCAALVLRKLEH